MVNLGGEKVAAGSMLVRQVGFTWKALFAKADGVVRFECVGKNGKRIAVYAEAIE